MANPEQLHGSEKGLAEVSKEAARRSGEGLKQVETEKPHEHAERLESARSEALKHAEAIAGPEHSAAETESQAPRSESTPANKKQREASFKQTMKTVQTDMSLPERTFSKVIHNPTVERVSDFVGKTIARPDALMSGALCSFLAVLTLYVTARYVGFALSGFETIGAFIVGWLIGLGYDLLKSGFGKK